MLRQQLMRSRKREPGRRTETAALSKVDGDVIRPQELPDTRNRRLERVRQRELRDRLSDHGEQRAGSLELELDRSSVPAAAQRLRGADTEGGEHGDLRFRRLSSRLEEELQGPYRRLAQLESRRPGGCARKVVAAVDGHCLPAREGTLGGCPRRL